MSEENQEWTNLPGVMDVAWDQDFARFIAEERRLKELAMQQRLQQCDAKLQANTFEERKKNFWEWHAANKFVPKGPHKDVLEATVKFEALLKGRDELLPTYEESCAHIDSLRKRGIPFSYPGCPKGHEKWKQIPVAPIGVTN